MWDPQRFALALAKLVETNDATDAQLMLGALIASICRKLRMGDDAEDVLQSTWAIILEKARDHQTYPSIAKQVRTIAGREAVNIIRTRERSKVIVERLDHYLKDIGVDVEADIASDAFDIDEALAALMERLREQHERQYDAVSLTLRSSRQEEARKKYEQLHNTTITPENFRQLHSRGTRRMRRFREQSND